MVNTSKNNIRNIYMANQNYNAAWKGRQFVGAPSNLAKYGNSAQECIQGYLVAVGAYAGAFGGDAAAVVLVEHEGVEGER